MSYKILEAIATDFDKKLSDNGKPEVELPEFFRDMQPWAGERERLEKRVKYLKEKFEKGLTVPFIWSYATLPDGTNLRVNGSNSSDAICRMDGNRPKDAVVYLTHYAIDAIEDMALIFRQHDDRASARSPLEVSGAYQGVIPSLGKVAKPTAKLAIEGIVWHMHRVDGLPVPKGDDIYEMYWKAIYQPFVEWLGTVVSVKTKELKRPEIVAAMYGCFLANEHEARAFWLDVARNGHDPNDLTDPSTALDAWLLVVLEGNGPKPLQEIKPAQVYQGCVNCWNSYRLGRPVKDVRFDTRKGLAQIEV